jgi:hypothetical protein
VICIFDKRPDIFVRDKLILSSERMLQKDYDRKGPVKKSLVVILKGLDAKTNWLEVNRKF